MKTIIKKSDLKTKKSRIEAFFRFITERELIRLRKEGGAQVKVQPYPWSTDEILSTYSFTNVRRSDDRTSRKFTELFVRVREERKQAKSHLLEQSRCEISTSFRKEILFNAALMRLVNRPETIVRIGWINAELTDLRDTVRFVNQDCLKSGTPFFGAGYVIPPGTAGQPKVMAIVDRVEEIWRMVQGPDGEWLKFNPAESDHWSWEDACHMLTKIKGIQHFCAKEIILEYINGCSTIFGPNRYNYPDDWGGWTPIGPGALRGISWILSGGPENILGQKQALNACLDLRDAQFEHAHLLLDRAFLEESLAPTDIQFQLCEFDKYLRTLYGNGRPKKKYSPPGK